MPNTRDICNTAILTGDEKVTQRVLNTEEVRNRWIPIGDSENSSPEDTYPGGYDSAAVDSHHKALALISGGILLIPLGFYLPGNPQAPFDSGGIPWLFYAGISAGYIVDGGIVYLLVRSSQRPTFGQISRYSLLAVPFAFVLSAIMSFNDVRATSDVGWLALHLGIAVIFYPIAFGLVFGFDSGAAHRLMVGLVGLVALITVVFFIFFAPSSGIGVTFVFLGVVAVLLVDVVFAYPLYRLGVQLRRDRTP